jgi:hypothetical protein
MSDNDRSLQTIDDQILSSGVGIYDANMWRKPFQLQLEARKATTELASGFWYD